STFGTTPFGGALTAGSKQRLLVHGHLDRTASAVIKAKPVTYEAELTFSGGGPITVSGKVDPPWATAGPAAGH
ncbi:MAG: hypothetical protein JWP87_3472, partial [Labilithrix sp.]|nr:hypothetical protein [Labilithrix sp.]